MEPLEDLFCMATNDFPISSSIKTSVLGAQKHNVFTGILAKDILDLVLSVERQRKKQLSAPCSMEEIFTCCLRLCEHYKEEFLEDKIALACPAHSR